MMGMSCAAVGSSIGGKMPRRWHSAFGYGIWRWNFICVLSVWPRPEGEDAVRRSHTASRKCFGGSSAPIYRERTATVSTYHDLVAFRLRASERAFWSVHAIKLHG